jgi:hypothetical protein
MVITLDPELEIALNEMARRRRIAPEVLALNVLRERLLVTAALQPRDEWERGLLAVAQDCGVSLPDSALSSEALCV